MRESINGAWLLGIVMVFMVIFIAYISISINYSNAYRMKTQMVTALEQYEGFNEKSLARLEAIRSGYNYTNTAPCDVGENGQAVGVLDGVVSTTNPPTGVYNYCITREKRPAQDGEEDKYYYTIVVFFDFNLPVLGDIFKFKVSGETNVIYYPNDTKFTR